MNSYDLDEIKQEFLKYAPAYAQAEAAQALHKLEELQSQGLIRNGVYYIILVDLVGSTKFAGENGNEKANKRIKLFVKSCFDAMVVIKITNTGIFLKEIGDAVLYVFQHFGDFIKWRNELNKYLELYGEISGHPYEIRTCVHIGEVSLVGVNPLSLAVSQTFKMEKIVKANHIVLTHTAYNIAWASLKRAYHGFVDYGTVELDGYKEPVKLHQLILSDKDDLQRIVEEQESED